MRGVDVNVLVHAHRPEAERHPEFRAWLDHARMDNEPLGLSDLVLSGFVRIVTHPRVFVTPTPTAVALDFANTLRESPATVSVRPGPRHWRIFQGLCDSIQARGNDVPDAYLAALALEQGTTWYTCDRGFARFPGLSWRHPLDS